MSHGVNQALIIGSHRLAAEFVIYFDAIVVWRIMGGRKIDAANDPDGAQAVDEERQFRRGQHGMVRLWLGQIYRDTVGGVNRARQFGEGTGRYPK